MTRRRPFPSEPLRVVLALASALLPMAGASGQAMMPQDQSSERQVHSDGPPEGAPMAPFGQTATIAGGQEGRRLSGREAGMLRSPSSRVSNRIPNRIESRLRTRIDRSFVAPADNLDQFRRAAEAAADEVSQDDGGEPDGQ